MSLFDCYWLSILLAFAALVFGLAVLVQILQEFNKLLTSSKFRSFTRALSISLRKWAVPTLQETLLLTIRSPFQWTLKGFA